MRRPRIRLLFWVAAAVLGILALGAMGALAWSSSTLQRTTSTVVRDTQAMAIASELELELLGYHRLGNVYFLSRDPALEGPRRESEATMQRLLIRARAFAGGAHERRLLEEASQSLQTYLDASERLRRQGAELEVAVTETRPLLNQAVRDLEALRDWNQAEVRQAQDSATRTARISMLAGLAAALLLFAGTVAATLALRELVLRPILHLDSVIHRFREGDRDVRAREEGSRETSDLAEAFNEMLGALARQRERQLAFLAGVAHDLRNPLSALKLAVYSAESPPPGPRRAEALDVLHRQLDRLTRLVDDLLDATRIEAGQLELKLAEVDLREPVREITTLYGPTSEEHEVKLSLPDQPVTVRADSLRVEQVVANLLSNALKFSPGGTRVDVAVGADAGEAHISVTDRGIGIPEDKLDDIFMPFRRPSGDDVPGTGLGLSITRRIVTAHGGRIEVASRPGAGSTFTVWLPRGGPPGEASE